jgi:hypothetical protein
MVKPAGRINRNALQQTADSFSVSGQLRSSVDGEGSFKYDVNSRVAQLQKNQALEPGAGRLTFAAGTLYVPQYRVSRNPANVTVSLPASGFTAPREGVYAVDANVAVSGVANEVFAGVCTVDGVEASGTTSHASSEGTGAAVVNVRGVVHADVNQVINVGVRSLHQTLTTVGTEDLVIAPAANLTVTELASDELRFNEG